MMSVLDVYCSQDLTRHSTFWLRAGRPSNVTTWYPAPLAPPDPFATALGTLLDERSQKIPSLADLRNFCVLKMASSWHKYIRQTRQTVWFIISMHLNFWVQNSSSSFISCALPCTSLKENLGDFSCCTMKQSTIETLTTPCETSLEKNGNHCVQHGSMAQHPCLTLSTALADFVCLSLPGLFDLNKSPCGEIQPLHV